MGKLDKKKVITLLIAALVVLMMVAGCSTNTENTETSSTDQQEQTYTFKLATWIPTTHPLYQVVTDFKDKVEKDSNGTITIEIYPADQLGDYTEVFKELKMGTINMGIQTVSNEFDPKIDALNLHYLVTSYDDVKSVFAQGSYMNQLMSDTFDAQGVKVLGGWVCCGFGGIGLTKEPQDIFEPGTEKGVLLRTPPMDNYRVWAEAMGYRTVTVAYSELTAAMQTGICDGWTGGQPASNYSTFKDIIKYYVQYGQNVEMDPIMINKATFDSLSAEQQNVLIMAAQAAQEEGITIAQKTDSEYLQKLKDAGIQVYEPTDEQIQAIVEYTRTNVWPKMADSIGQDVIDNLQASLSE